jgi:hypothetical protein
MISAGAGRRAVPLVQCDACGRVWWGLLLLFETGLRAHCGWVLLLFEALVCAGRLLTE